MNDDYTASQRAASRLVRVEDAEVLTDLVVRNRAYMAPWDPIRPEEYFTPEGQRDVIVVALAHYSEGTLLPHVVLDGNDTVDGRINLGNIVRGAFQSGGLGYWVSENCTGRGHATAAVAHMKAIAFDELGLHRLQAETPEHNMASQRVLARNGFERFGFAPAYLNIAGRWQDHVMFQVINPDPIDL